MPGIDNLPAFLLAASLIILVPGPATLYVAGRVQSSTMNGYVATLGIVAGDIVLITLSGLGFAALVSQWPILLDVIKFAGGMYILYLAFEMLNSPPAQVDSKDVKARQGGFLKALMITLTNPKPILFFAAFFPMFIDRDGGSTMRSFYALGLLFEVLNVMYFAVIITVVARLHRMNANGRFGGAAMHKISAYGLALCAAFILLA